MATINQVYRGTTTLPSGTAVTSVTLSVPVNTLSAILMFSIRADGDRNNISSALVSGSLDNSTTISFERSAASTIKNLTINWTIYEFAASVTVNRGITTLTVDGATNVTIPSVDLTKTFVILSTSISGTQNDYGRDENVRATLTSSTNLQLFVDSNAVNRVCWQVIEYQHCTVQQHSFTMLGNTTQADLTITSVNLSRTMVIGSYSTTEGKVTAAKQPSYYLLDSTTIRFTRFVTTGSNQDWVLFVIQFDENEVRVSNLSSIVNVADTVINVSISEIFTHYSLLKINSNTTNSFGMINDTEDDFSLYSFTSQITSITSLQFQRASVGAAGNLYYQLIEFIPREKRPIIRGIGRGILRQHVMT